MNVIDHDDEAVDGQALAVLREAPAIEDDLDGFIGSGSVAVDHNYGGADALRYVTQNGAGIEDAVVRAYLSSEYSQGNRGGGSRPGEAVHSRLKTTTCEAP